MNEYLQYLTNEVEDFLFPNRANERLRELNRLIESRVFDRMIMCPSEVNRLFGVVDGPCL